MGSVMICIDPGENTGWSKWLDGRLVLCGLSHPKHYPELPFVMGLTTMPPTLVIELPEDYSTGRKTDPNNLISLGFKCGAIYGILAAYYHLSDQVLERELVHPKDWKGQVPKNIHHDRHLPKLDPSEKSVLQSCLARVAAGKRHDVKDSVCLGLWKLNR